MKAAIADVIRSLKLVLFAAPEPEQTASWDEQGRAQFAKYGHLGLRYVAADKVPDAIDELFTRMNLKAGQRLLEIGPGPHGGIGLIAALPGLHVVTVEYDRPFLVDVDRLRQQLASMDGSQAALPQLPNLSGSMHITTA